MTRAIFPLAGACLVVAGAITLGASRSEPAPRTDADAIKALLNIYTKKLEEPPTDQMFGVTRIEPSSFSGHGLAASDYKFTTSQLSKGWEWAAFVYGGWKDAQHPRMRLAASQRREGTTGERYPYMHSISSRKPLSDNHPARYEREFSHAVGMFFKGTKDLGNETVTTPSYGNRPTKQIILDMKKIYPSSDSCISCHPGSSKTVPIGVIGIARIAKPKQ